VLDAQRTLITAREQRVRALGDYRRAVVTLERLLGEPLDPERTTDAERTLP
jgi:outer membrane protein TolC